MNNINQQIQFTANFVFNEKNEDEQYLSIGFADDEFKFDYYVLLNRSFSDDKQDKALGMNAEYIEINDQSSSGYNICKKAVLGKDYFQLFLEMDKECLEVIINIKKVVLEKTSTDCLKYILGDKLEIIC